MRVLVVFLDVVTAMLMFLTAFSGEVKTKGGRIFCLAFALLLVLNEAALGFRA